jgi:predicted  nucleic acid-binding Zn-ribbon protein
MPYSNVSITRVTSGNADVIVAYEESELSPLLSIAVDYTDYYIRIASAIENLTVVLAQANTNLSSINDSLSNSVVSLSSINNSLKNIDTYIDNLNDRGSDKLKGIYVASEGAFTNQQNRALVMSELKKDEVALQELEDEINNPTPLPGDTQ